MTESLCRLLMVLLCLAIAPPAIAGSYDDILAAANKDETAQVIDLLKRGMDVNTTDPSGNTLLMLAARNANGELLEFLIRNRANLQKRNQYGDTAVMLAALRGHATIVRKLVVAGADIGNDGWNALHYAAYAGLTEIVQLLVDSKKANLDAAAPNGQTALMLAVKNGNLDVVRILIDADADMDLNDYDGDTALTLAEKGGHSDIAEYLRQSGAEE